MNIPVGYGDNLGEKKKKMHPHLLYIKQVVSGVVSEAKSPMGEENSNKVLKLALGITICKALAVVLAHGGARGCANSCDVDKDPVQKTVQNRGVPWNNKVRQCTVHKGAIRLTDTSSI